jgi:hypothetical protein
VTVVQTQITLPHIHVIAEAIGAEWAGSKLKVMDWRRVLEFASFEGIDVFAELLRINNSIPQWATPLRLATLPNRLNELDILDRNIPGKDYRTKFEATRMKVRHALGAFKAGKADAYIFGRALCTDRAYMIGWTEGLKEANHRSRIELIRDLAG